MRIVIDIDNTIVDYRLAILKSITKNDKSIFVNSVITNENSIIDIKNFIKDNYGDYFWQLIQSEIYSTFENISFYDDATKVIKELALRHDIYLVSHKTKYGLGKSKNVNILKISTKRIFKWIFENDLIDSIKSVIYCDSFDEKIRMIKFINPDVIIDDLEKIHVNLIKINGKINKKLHILFRGTSSNEIKKIKDEIIYLNSWIQIFEYLNINHEIRK